MKNTMTWILLSLTLMSYASANCRQEMHDLKRSHESLKNLRSQVGQHRVDSEWKSRILFEDLTNQATNLEARISSLEACVNQLKDVSKKAPLKGYTDIE